MRHWCWFVLLGMALASCVSTPSPVSPPPATLSPTPSPSPVFSPTPAAPLDLVIWVPDSWISSLDTPTGQALQQQLQAFAGQYPGYTVSLRLKKATGAGGMLELLSVANQVAPSVLPDLVLFEQGSLQEAYQKALLTPLALSAERAGAWPAALQASVSDGETWYAVPYLLDLEQALLVPHAQERLPLTWDALLSEDYHVLIPAGNADLADPALVAWYLSTGAGIVDERGNPALERNALETLYRFIRTLQETEALDPVVVRGLTDAQAAWELFTGRPGTLSVVPGGSYWTAPSAAGLPMTLPGLTAPAVAPVTRFLAWGYVRRDPTRQEAALALLDWLTAPEQINAISMASQMLPADRNALALRPFPAEQAAALTDILNASYVFPSPLVERSIRRALQAGLIALLDSPDVTPTMAAAVALGRLRE